MCYLLKYCIHLYAILYYNNIFFMIFKKNGSLFLAWIMTASVFAGCQSTPSKPTDHPPSTYKIVLIAGPNDHCSDNSKPCHKYIQDLLIVRDCLREGKNGIDIDVQMYVGERPPIGSLEDVDVVVVHTSADRYAHEWHGIFPPNPRAEEYQDADYKKFLKYFDAKMDGGMGLVVLHYATWVDHPIAQDRYSKWVGGYYLDGKSNVDGDSNTPGTTATETVELASPEHPILNGVKPWTSVAEYYHRMYFGEDPNRIIPILKSSLPKEDPKPETIAWAMERPDGGRGFGFTGCHNHENMYIPDFRKFVLNAIIWTAGAEVPEVGFESELTKTYFK